MLLAPDAATLRAKIIGYGPNPGAGSGIMMVLRPVDVAMADGSRRRLYFIHAGENEFIHGRIGETYPAIGSTCDFSTVVEHVFREPDDGSLDFPTNNVIVDIHCNYTAKPD